MCVCVILFNSPLSIRAGLYWLSSEAQLPTTSQSHSVYLHYTLYLYTAQVKGGLSECVGENGGQGSRICVFVLFTEIKLLTELKIISQEGCLCATEAQDLGSNTQIVQWVCDASCSGAWLCVWAKDRLSHKTHTHIVNEVSVCKDLFSCLVNIPV